MSSVIHCGAAESLSLIYLQIRHLSLKGGMDSPIGFSWMAIRHGRMFEDTKWENYIRHNSW